MWQVANHTPFSAAGTFTRDRAGAEHWVVCVVGLFEVNATGSIAVADRQKPPLLAPLYTDRSCRELILESDLAPFRPRPEFILAGMACLPGGKPARSMDANIAVGRVSKSARVHGERVARWIKGRAVVDAAETTGVRLTWRNALGGTDLCDSGALPHPANPIGIGWASDWARLPDGMDLRLPPIEHPDRPVQPGRPSPEPHGFGPVQPAWLPRAGHAGTYGEQWRRERSPLPPDDFAEQFHQAAPTDQVYPAPLEGAVPVRLSGLHPDGPYGFTLPQIVLTSRTRIGSEAVDSRLRLIGMALDGTERVLRLTWNTHVVCTGRDHMVQGSRVMLKQMAGVTA